MPPAPTTDFSYAQDVQPYASRFFDRIDASSTLSHGAKMSIQSTLLNGMEDIETQRLKLQQERDEGRGRRLAYEDTAFRLENARAARTRAEQQESRRAGVTGMAKSILDGKGDPETKRQMLARTALDFADDKDALETFDIATKALPRGEEKSSLISDASALAMILDGIPQEEITHAKSTGDYSRVGALSRKLKMDHEVAVENKRLGLAQDKEARTVKLGLAKTPLKFAKDEASGTDTDRMEDESTNHATAIVQALGTDEDIQKFIALNGAPSDRERASLARDIQLRHLQKAAGREDATPDGRKSASSVTGF